MRHVLYVVKNSLIGETDDRITQSFDNCCATFIVQLLVGLVVVSTINLYHQFLLQTDEVCYVVPYWMLASEMEAL